MLNRIKEWIKKHTIYEMIPFYIVGIAIIASLIAIFFAYYKAPISLENKEDSTAIMKMLNQQNIDCDIENAELKEGVVYLALRDSIYKISDKIKNDNDLLWYTRVIKYQAINGSDTINCATIFEINESFLKENVGKHLITIKGLE